MAGDVLFSRLGIPEAVCKLVLRIANEDALMVVELQGLPLLLLDQDICKTAKDAKARDVRSCLPPAGGRCGVGIVRRWTEVTAVVERVSGVLPE